jgi:acyl-CoA thioesterase-1
MNKSTLTAALFIVLLAAGCGNKKPSDDKTAVAVANKPSEGSESSKKTILFFGDSLTAGYGLDDPSEAFPGVIKSRIDSLKLPYNVINAGVSGETSAGGLARIDWVLKQKIDVFILELGANDGLRGTAVKETEKNLQAIIDKVKTKYPKAKILLLGMQVPPSMGATYVRAFKGLFPALTIKNHLNLVPFLLSGVAGEPALNQADGIHPNPEGAKIAAGNVWKILKTELTK